MLDHATSEMANGSKPGFDAANKILVKVSNAPAAAHQDGWRREGEGAENIRMRRTRREAAKNESDEKPAPR